MSSFNKQVTVPYTAEQMYDLVNDINAYPKFTLYVFNPKSTKIRIIN